MFICVVLMDFPFSNLCWLPQPFGGASLLTPNPSSAPGQEPLLLDMSQPSDKVL